MPDLVLGMAPGWRTSWETPLGGIPEELFEDNRKKWSGDHASSNAADTEGILFLNRKLAPAAPSIADIAPTVMNLFGVKPPAYMDGRNLLP
jgi:predicted AlkP superfamily phosphohydrolase/phosphomutase